MLSLSKNLLSAIKELGLVRNQASALGIFTHDRDLLGCLECGLIEDVTYDGLLITYHPRDKNVVDSGLRFEEIGEGVFRCPVCREKVICDE